MKPKELTKGSFLAELKKSGERERAGRRRRRRKRRRAAAAAGTCCLTGT